MIRCDTFVSVSSFKKGPKSDHQSGTISASLTIHAPSGHSLHIERLYLSYGINTVNPEARPALPSPLQQYDNFTVLFQLPQKDRWQTREQNIHGYIARQVNAESECHDYEDAFLPSLHIEGVLFSPEGRGQGEVPRGEHRKGRYHGVWRVLGIDDTFASEPVNAERASESSSAPHFPAQAVVGSIHGKRSLLLRRHKRKEHANTLARLPQEGFGVDIAATKSRPVPAHRSASATAVPTLLSSPTNTSNLPLRRSLYRTVSSLPPVRSSIYNSSGHLPDLNHIIRDEPYSSLTDAGDIGTDSLGVVQPFRPPLFPNKILKISARFMATPKRSHTLEEQHTVAALHGHRNDAQDTSGAFDFALEGSKLTLEDSNHPTSMLADLSTPIQPRYEENQAIKVFETFYAEIFVYHPGEAPLETSLRILHQMRNVETLAAALDPSVHVG